MLTGQDAEALASIVTCAGAELADGFAATLAYLSFLSRAAQATPAGWGDEVYEQLTKFLRGWADTMNPNRRELLQLLGWAATTVAASPVVNSLDTEEQERLARAIVSPSRVDEQVIDHLEAMLRHCKRQEDALGTRTVLNTALAQRNLVRSLLDECPATLRPRLLSVYSDMSTSIGYYFFDLNDVGNARYYCDKARAAAHDAGNTDLVVYALGEMSDHASWHGKATTAIEFAAAAQSLVSKTEDPLMQVCAAQRAATAHAVDGQYQACMVEFAQAQAGLESSTGQSSSASPAYWYNAGLIASQQSDCLLRLGRPQEAAASASAGLQLYDKSFVDGHAFCNLHLGNARLQSGDIDEAARVVGSAAGLAAQTRSARLAKELCTTRTRMQPWQDTQAVKALDDQLAAYGLMSSSPT